MVKNKLYCPLCCKEVKQNELLIGIGGCVYCPENENFTKDEEKIIKVKKVGEDPCYYSCGGSVHKLEEGLKKGIKIRVHEWGDDIEGTCPNCQGRGRKIHLEYIDEGEVMCMVCSKIFKLSEVKK